MSQSTAVHMVSVEIHPVGSHVPVTKVTQDRCVKQLLIDVSQSTAVGKDNAWIHLMELHVPVMRDTLDGFVKSLSLTVSLLIAIIIRIQQLCHYSYNNYSSAHIRRSL